ncbi:MAG: MerR family DNA-binding transcriptional regulator [Lachnospiraceae bacterium]|nr:MerR family DNA-binding transcriptional regulator [Lachnospiraceae bacterium]
MYYSIKEFSEKIGVSASTLREWEKKGTLLPHHKTKGGHRIYSDMQAEEYLGKSRLVISCGEDVIYTANIANKDGTLREDVINEADMAIRNAFLPKEEGDAKCGK